uniref:Uncharacterized protein n=1 Tax=Anguilla anguilla TaxID=7936 RepID=A0A0E9WXY5_ANGAN
MSNLYSAGVEIPCLPCVTPPPSPYPSCFSVTIKHKRRPQEFTHPHFMTHKVSAFGCSIICSGASLFPTTGKIEKRKTTKENISVIELFGLLPQRKLKTETQTLLAVSQYVRKKQNGFVNKSAKVL